MPTLSENFKLKCSKKEFPSLKKETPSLRTDASALQRDPASSVRAAPHRHSAASARSRLPARQLLRRKLASAVGRRYDAADESRGDKGAVVGTSRFDHRHLRTHHERLVALRRAEEECRELRAAQVLERVAEAAADAVR